jgi:hypothetical protein
VPALPQNVDGDDRILGQRPVDLIRVPDYALGQDHGIRLHEGNGEDKAESRTAALKSKSSSKTMSVKER